MIDINDTIDTKAYKAQSQCLMHTLIGLHVMWCQP